MKICEFFQILYPYYGDGHKEAMFLNDFLSQCVEEENIDHLSILKLEEDSLKRIYTGKMPFAGKHASNLLGCINKECFEKYICDVKSDDVLITLCQKFENYVGVSTKYQIADKIYNLFIKILENTISKNSNKNLSLAQDSSNWDLDAELEQVVRTLAKISKKDLDIELKYTATAVYKKIPSDQYALLFNQVNDDVVEYYLRIEKLFKSLSHQNSMAFDYIAKSVKNKCDLYIQDGYPLDIIFDKMVDWFKNKISDCSSIACRLIISFFVQNCEVFHEITE